MHFTGNERFLLAFPSSLLSGYALNKQTGHGRERDLNIRGQFSPYREWYGLLIYNTYPIPTETPHLSGGEISHLAINFKRSVRVGNTNIPFGFRRQTCEKLWYLSIYLRFALVNLFYISISFSPVILKGTINPQSSENEILEYSSWNFATLNSVLNRFALNFTESLPLLFYCN
mgnify:CR=1 FL=1